MWEALKLLALAAAIAAAVLLLFTYIASRLFTRRRPTWNGIADRVRPLQPNELLDALRLVRLAFSGVLAGVAVVGLLGISPAIGAGAGFLALFATKIGRK